VAQASARGQRFAVAFDADPALDAFQRAGFSSHPITEWTFHKRFVREWQDLLTALFERVRVERPEAPIPEQQNEAA
jgi:hypothetical protein